MFLKLGKIIRLNYLRVLDFFYPLVKRWIKKDLYYYLTSGALNTCSDWIMYFLVYNFLVQKQIIDFGFIAFTPHIASLIICFPITFSFGFILSKYISFSGSPIRTKKQLLRYLIILTGNFIISYISLKILVEWFTIYPTPSKMITTIFTTIFSYFAQKYYTFKK